MTNQLQAMPELPEATYLGQDIFGYDIQDMHDYAITYAESLRVELEAAMAAIDSMKQEAETGAQGDYEMMLDACNEISKQGLAVLPNHAKEQSHDQ